MASNDNRDRLIRTFMARTNTGRRKRPGKPGIRTNFPQSGQGEDARFVTKSSNNGGGQYYVSQGKAVENAANARNYTQGRARTEREQSQQRMRHALGYDKNSVVPASVKRKAKKAIKKVNPFD